MTDKLPVTKKRTNPKKKGDSFERAIAKKLGEWWGDKFQRTPASGGLHWKKDNRVYGDIVTPEGSDFPFVVECKNRESWNMDALFKGSKEVEKWWVQVTKDAKDTGLKPMLIFTRNNQPDYVALKKEDAFLIIDFDMDVIRIRIQGEGVCIVRLDEFIELHSKEDVMSGLNEMDAWDILN